MNLFAILNGNGYVKHVIIVGLIIYVFYFFNTVVLEVVEEVEKLDLVAKINLQPPGGLVTGSVPIRKLVLRSSDIRASRFFKDLIFKNKFFIWMFYTYRHIIYLET